MMFSWSLPLCYKTKKSPAQQGFSLYPYRSITPIFTAQNISPRFSAAAYCLASATMRVLFGPIPDGHSDCAKALHQVLFAQTPVRVCKKYIIFHFCTEAIAFRCAICYNARENWGIIHSVEWQTLRKLCLCISKSFAAIK